MHAMPDPTTMTVGDLRVTLLNAGDLVLRMADELAVPESAWRPEYAGEFDAPLPYPSLSVLIQDPAGGAALVDANDYRATVPADSPYLAPGYTPPPDIPAQLAALGVAADAVSDVVITHAHWDHFAGTTRPGPDGERIPTFPRARHHLGAADWRDPELQAALGDPESLESRTLGVLHRRGLLNLVDAPLALTDAVEVLPAPGETPGHQIVRVHSRGETLYAVGDLFHHPAEVAHPEWMVTWADAATMEQTRRRVIAAALAEGATLVAAHVARPGHIEAQGADGARWVNR
jgi:glyoxylase-like metal-dependent hydrolase (beta-lactamase superfamily II)